MANKLTTIWVTFQKEGIHRYPEAETNPELKDVSFLAYPHRHIFHFRVELEVFHDNRDIEFILLKRKLEQQYDSGALILDFKSCEMIANDVYQYLARELDFANHPRTVSITVSEDNENGATVTVGR
jgi:hypothetical protein